MDGKDIVEAVTSYFIVVLFLCFEIRVFYVGMIQVEKEIQSRQGQCGQKSNIAAEFVKNFIACKLIHSINVYDTRGEGVNS